MVNWTNGRYLYDEHEYEAISTGDGTICNYRGKWTYTLSGASTSSYRTGSWIYGCYEGRDSWGPVKNVYLANNSRMCGYMQFDTNQNGTVDKTSNAACATITN